MKRYLCLIPMLLALCACQWLGFKPINPDADKFVVEVERFQTIAKPTLDGVLQIDDLQRDFWKTKAPAFHEFCAWLRVPTKMADGSVLPRDRALQMSLTLVKVDYKKGTKTSNELYSALMTLKSAVNQANAWLTIATNTPTPTK